LLRKLISFISSFPVFLDEDKMNRNDSQTQTRRTDSTTTRRDGFMNWWVAAGLAHGAGAG
jgi:hypothetical protein